MTVFAKKKKTRANTNQFIIFSIYGWTGNLQIQKFLCNVLIKKIRKKIFLNLQKRFFDTSDCNCCSNFFLKALSLSYRKNHWFLGVLATVIYDNSWLITLIYLRIWWSQLKIINDLILKKTKKKLFYDVEWRIYINVLNNLICSTIGNWVIL